MPEASSRCVPEEKFAYEKYTCCKLAANCARSVQETVCQRKKMHKKSILAASMPQLVAAQLLHMRFKYTATVRHRAYILVRDHITKHGMRVPNPGMSDPDEVYP
jgi:hypothetical protein